MTQSRMDKYHGKKPSNNGEHSGNRQGVLEDKDSLLGMFDDEIDEQDEGLTQQLSSLDRQELEKLYKEQLKKDQKEAESDYRRGRISQFLTVTIIIEIILLAIVLFIAFIM